MGWESMLTLASCRRELSGRELVAELLYAFLLPEVEKQSMRDRGECTPCSGEARLESCLGLLQCATISAATCWLRTA